MIKILHFASVINRYDFIDTVLTELDKSNFQIRALTVTEPKNRVGAYSAAEEYESRCLQLPLERRNYPKIFSRLKAEIVEFGPDILQTHHFDETVMGAILVRMGMVRRFVIGHHYSDHIYVLNKGLKRKFFLHVEKWCNGAADRIVVPSQEVVSLLRGQGEDMKKVSQIPYGTDPTMLNAVNRVNVEAIRREFKLDEKVVALTSCRLNKEKGLDYLIKALPEILEQIPTFRLFMAGEGEKEPELRQMVSDLGLSSVVTFLGWRKDVLDWISACDFVIQPSLSESFCQVVIESLILEKPIVVTPVGVAPDAIKSGERGGILVQIGSSSDIVRAVVSLSADRKYRDRLAQKGKDFVLSNFTIHSTASKYENIYSEILQKRILN